MKSLIIVPALFALLIALFLVVGISDMLVRGMATGLLISAAVFIGMALEGRPGADQ